jgi:hypothetical protein
MLPPVSTAAIGRGISAANFLASQGIKAVPAHVRSSDIGAPGDPFGYYLRRRLGLIPALKRFDALEHGSWAHVHFEYLDRPFEEAYSEVKATILPARSMELRDAGIRGGFPEDSDTIKDAIAEAEYDMDLTACWMQAAREVEVPGYGYYHEFFNNRDYWEVIGREVTISVPVGDTFATIQIDLLLYSKVTIPRLGIEKDRLYIVDLKTCKEPTNVRAASCPVEFQAVHYPYTLDRALREGLVDCLTADDWSEKKVGGVFHLIIQKPQIRMGAADRPYSYSAYGKRKNRSGYALLQADGTWTVQIIDHANNGEKVTTPARCEDHAFNDLWNAVGKKPEKEFTDDPDPGRYLERVKAWYRGEGVDPGERADALPVNISFTNSHLIDRTSDEFAEYEVNLAILEELATRPPEPCMFPRNARKGMVEWGRLLSPYSPFYTQPVHQWPEIIARGHFITEHRDA